MKIAIVLVARDIEILSFFKKRRNKVIPAEVMRQDRYNVVYFDARCSNEELIEFLLKVHASHDAVGVLIEDGEENRLNGYACAVFHKAFSPAEAKAKNSLQNYFSFQLTRWLKNLIFLLNTFNEGKNRKCLMLPQYSFSAAELNAIFQLCRNGNENGNFTQSLETNLKKLRDRSNPKTHQHDHSRKQYLVDDSARHFELGKEGHGQSETGRPPHLAECAVTGSSRFGITLERKCHYNVTLAKGNISGIFRDCHGGNDTKDKDHLDMFPNGFIR